MRPPLALPVGPEGRELANWAPQIARGPWRTLERDLADDVLVHLTDRVTPMTSTGWALTGSLCGGLGQFEAWDIERPERWAQVRVRVSVEVLDGVL